MQRSAVRDITYSGSGGSRTGRGLIRALENATGRLSLIRRARGYEHDIEAGRSIWQVMPDRFGLSLDLVGGALSNIPSTGPLIVIANHPYGILDGLMLGHLLHTTRGDFRILANAVFRRAEAINRHLLPISFDTTPEAQAMNVATRAAALAHLAQDGAIGVFPGGTVSTAATPFAKPMDPAWRSFTARMIARSGADVVPVFFEGANSRAFQLASHLHTNLRLGLLLKEFRARIDHPVRIVIGQPIDPAAIAARRTDPRALMDFLRRQTYALSTAPNPSYDYGHEFEAHHRLPEASSWQSASLTQASAASPSSTP